MKDTEYWKLNRANWDERVAVHLKAESYSLDRLRSGKGALHPIEEAELGSVDGLKVLHLQCHFGRDTLVLAQRGANVVGLDFSPAAITAAAKITEELGLSACARFVEADLYDAPSAIPEPGSFDLVYVTWGALGWLPDIERWAEIVAQFLKIGGTLYLADGHPSALVFDDSNSMGNKMPGYFAPYFLKDPLIIKDARDYADDDARLSNDTSCEWMHTLADIVTGITTAGMSLKWLHEHDSLPWRMFSILHADEHGMYRWPDQAWLPLGFSLKAQRIT